MTHTKAVLRVYIIATLLTVLALYSPPARIIEERIESNQTELHIKQGPHDSRINKDLLAASFAAQPTSAGLTINFGCIVPLDASHLRIFFGYTSPTGVQSVRLNMADSTPALIYSPVPASYQNIPANYTEGFFVDIVDVEKIKVLEFTFIDLANTARMVKFDVGDFQDCNNYYIDPSPPPGSNTPEPP